jgi:regulator of protease activity HflC (stomatin/prohibitin superfamily)
MNDRILTALPGRSGASPKKTVTLVVTLVICISFLFLIYSAWRSVHPGYVGIVFDKANHQVTASRLEPGWALINPFTQAIQEYPVTIRTYSMVQKSAEGYTSGDDSIKIQSSEGQQLNLDFVIQYQVIKEESAALYQDWGGADITYVEDGVVRQYTRTQVPSVVSKYSWEHIVSKGRDEIIKELETRLTEEFLRRHLRLVSVGIREVHLPAALQTALNQKIQAQQIAEQQKYQLEQAKVKAEQDVAEATGRANALKAQAEGEASATLTRATAQAQANRKLSENLTSELIQYQLLQRWDGQLPMMSGASTPLIDVGKMMATRGALQSLKE